MACILIVGWVTVFTMMIRAVLHKDILWPQKQEDRDEGGWRTLPDAKNSAAHFAAQEDAILRSGYLHSAEPARRTRKSFRRGRNEEREVENLEIEIGRAQDEEARLTELGKALSPSPSRPRPQTRDSDLV